jgi:NAD(P)H-hydrate repair Nnr-like enzyme with NAD(P)H-hydrate epimerase domain
MSFSSRRLVAVPSLLAAGLALAPVAGCGKTVIDDAKTEAAIEQNLERSAGKKVASVDCPSDVEVEKGERFDCVVSLDGGKEETATMKILNEDADIELTNLKAAK